MTNKATILHQLIEELPEFKLTAAEHLLTKLQQEDQEVRKTMELLGGDPTLYDTDFYAWTQAEAAALAAKRWDQLDVAHLVEEIRDLGNEQAHAVESHLSRLLQHLLKWRYQPAHRSRSWQRSITVARQQIARRLRRNPSLRPQVPTFLNDAYRDARRLARLDTDLPLATFPETCPWGLDQLLDEDFWPEGDTTSRR
jgi:hypothetical protein